MIFFKLDYVIELEQAGRRDAAQCAAYAKQEAAWAEPGAWFSKMGRVLKSLAFEYLTRQSWQALDGVFVPTPMILERTDGVVTRTEMRPNHARAVKRLVGVKLSQHEAECVWLRLLEHKWYLGERLGRDVGLRVAAVDYFENIHQPRKQTQTRGVWEPLPRLPMMMPFGERG